MKAEYFINELVGLQFDNTFNPYADCCEIHDYAHAPARRRAVLKKMLDAAVKLRLTQFG